MINSVNALEQDVAVNGTVIFTTDRVRTRACGIGGWLQHDNESGAFTIVRPGIYKVDFNANVTSAEASKVPNNYTKVEDEEALRKLALFFDALDEDDDVQNVYNNLENTEDLPEL